MFISLLIPMMMLAGSRPLINTMLGPTIQFRSESYNQLCVLLFVEIMCVCFFMVNLFSGGMCGECAGFGGYVPAA